MAKMPSDDLPRRPGRAAPAAAIVAVLLHADLVHAGPPVAEPSVNDPETPPAARVQSDPFAETAPATAPEAPTSDTQAQTRAPAEDSERAPASTREPPLELEGVDERERMARILDGDNEIADRYRRGQGMVIGGSVALGIAITLVGVASFYGVKAEYFAPLGMAGNARKIAIGVGVAAAVVAIPGSVLLPLGLLRQRDARREARRRASAGLGSGGLVVRF